MNKRIRPRGNAAPKITGRAILNRYTRGYSTETELILGMLNLSDREALIRSLELLPVGIQRKMQRFIGHYSAATRVFKGARPNPVAVRVAEKWLAAHLSPITNSQKPSESEGRTNSDKNGRSAGKQRARVNRVSTRAN